MLEKLKSLLQDEALYTSLIVIFVALASFGLGRMSVTYGENATQAESNRGIVIRESVPVIENNQENLGQKDFLVASKSGTKYHLLDCPGAKQIKEENKVYFSTYELAKAAGYTAAANCDGLK